MRDGQYDCDDVDGDDVMMLMHWCGQRVILMYNNTNNNKKIPGSERRTRSISIGSSYNSQNEE